MSDNYSGLVDFIADIAAMPVNYTDKRGKAVSLTSGGLEAIPASVQTGQLPIRIILPVGQGDTGHQIAINPGGMMAASWQVTDIALFEAQARDIGLETYAPVMMRYIIAYAEAIGGLWQFTHGWNVEGRTIQCNPQPGIWEYPAGSGVYFYGVRVSLTLTEIF